MPLAPRPADSRYAQETETVRMVDPVDLAATLGALSLVPANIDRQWRLGALTTLAAERIAAPEKRAISPPALRALLTAGGLASYADMHEDPYEDVLCEEVSYFEGPYLVSSGIGSEAVYILRLLIRVLLLGDALPARAKANLNLLAGTALKLSDYVLGEAGFERFQVPPASERGVVTIPGRTTLREAAGRLIFEPERLAEIVAPLDPQVLEPLILRAGTRAFDEDGLGEGDGEVWPILRFGERLVLARPLGLVLALNHQILLSAVGEIGEEALAAAFSKAVLADVRRSLRRIGIEASTVDIDGEFAELKGRIDTDVEMLCLIVTDDMQGLAAGPYAEAPDSPALAAASRRIEEAAKETNDRLLVLLVCQSSGRPITYGIRKIAAENVAVEAILAADLDVFAILEQGDPLTIWKFANSLDPLQRRGAINSFNILDTFSVYRSWGRSFARAAEVDLLTVPPGSGAQLRVDAKAQRDRHPVPYVDGTLREVEHDHGDPLAGRLYGLSEPDEPRLVRYVPGAPLALWTTGPSGEEAADQTWDLVETLAYWLAEIAPYAESRLSRLAQATPAIRLELEVGDPDFWFAGGEDPGGAGVGEILIDGPTAKIVLGPEIRRRAPAADNEADRLIVGLVLEGLGALFEAEGIDPIGEEERDAVREAVVPSGLKKHFLAFPAGGGNESLAPPAREPRLIQEADVTAVRERLGAYLVERFGHRGEEIPAEERRAVVRAAVEFLLAEIGTLLGSASPEGLLEQLLVANDGIVFEAERRRAILPARAETYPEATQHEELRDEVNRTNAAALAARFLVEHVAAQPPAGEEPWGLARYDCAMALCTVLVEHAYLDDAYHYEMSDVGLLIDEEDGQLHIAELDTYEQGRSRHFDDFLAEQQRTSERIFMRRFDTGSGPSESDLRDRVDPLVEAEAGASLTDIRELLHAASALARDRGEDVVALAREEAERTLAEMLGREQAKIAAAIEYLGMGPREKLLEPPDGDWHDVVPSRFARRWSLLRRPFLFRGEQVLWGRREVIAALFVIYGQFFSGRYHHLARAEELKAELGRLSLEAGARFEGRVAAIFSAAARFETLGNVTSLGNEKLERANGEILGDIDVLAADTRARILYAVECKDLAGALSPSEVAGELSEHFAEQGETAVKHSERIEWLSARIAPALKALGVEGAPEDWRVEGLFATGRPVMGPYIAKVAFEIVAVEALPGWIDSLPGPPAKKNRHRRKKHGKRRGR